MLSAQSATTRHLRPVSFGTTGDAFWNYDFGRETIQCGAIPCKADPRVDKDLVDWPMNLMFWNQAGGQYITTRMADVGYDQSGGDQYAFVKDGASFAWDPDPGRKKTKCPITGSTPHFRMYRNPALESSFDPQWGFYVIASSHFDIRECGRHKRFGDSERAERVIALAAAQVWGSSSIDYEYLNLGNPEPLRREGNHHWDNTGFATAIRVS